MDRPSMPPHPHDIDTELWVELEDSDVRWYVCGNPHTFPGHFDVWSPELDTALTVQKAEVTGASEAARWWIEGFLHGSEPSINEYLGVSPEYDVADDDPAWDDWRKALDDYRKSGTTIVTPRDIARR
jgi:hypothetical protein